jgi:hypothetical protein
VGGLNNKVRTGARKFTIPRVLPTWLLAAWLQAERYSLDDYHAYRSFYLEYTYLIFIGVQPYCQGRTQNGTKKCQGRSNKRCKRGSQHRGVTSIGVSPPSKSLFYVHKSHSHFSPSLLMSAVRKKGRMSLKRKMPACSWGVIN